PPGPRAPWHSRFWRSGASWPARRCGFRICSTRPSPRHGGKGAAVAETFLRKWFGGKPAAPAADEARAGIDRLLADRPNYRSPLTWLRAIADDLVPVPGYVIAVLPSPESAREELSNGHPLLQNQTVSVDELAFARRWQRVCDALQECQTGD